MTISAREEMCGVNLMKPKLFALPMGYGYIYKCVPSLFVTSFCEMESSREKRIVEFFKAKAVLVTGSTGFLAKSIPTFALFSHRT